MFNPVRTSRHNFFLDERGQASVEFALILPLLLLVLFAIVEFGRAYNAYNDLNQMAANGARLASVGRFPSDATALQQFVDSESDTNVTKAALVEFKYFQNGSEGSCVVGGSVLITATAPIQLAAILKAGTINLHGKAEMRVERCPT